MHLVCVYLYTMHYLILPKTPLLEPRQTIIIKNPSQFYIVIVQPILNVHLLLPSAFLKMCQYKMM